MKATMNNTESAQATTVSTNPFAFDLTATETSATRRLDFTPALQEKARARATELVKACANPEKPDLQAMANKMMDTGVAADLLDLIHAVYSEEDIQSDASVLDECPEEDLAKMLESQRSNRSKAKHTGLRTKLPVTITYIASMYAELMIRVKTGKAYNGSARTLAVDVESLKNDPDQLKRKINSLASKKSRLSKLAEFDDEAKTELDEVEAQLAELRALRPAKTRTAVKSMPVAELKKALKELDKDGLPEDLLALIAKIG